MTDNPQQHQAPLATPPAYQPNDDINIPLVVSGVAVSAILLFVLVVLLQAWYYHSMAQEAQAKMEPSAPLVQMRADQEQQLTTTRWVMEPKRIVAIPVAQAIDLTLPSLQSGTPEGAGK